MILIRRRNRKENEARFHALTIQAMLDRRWSVVHEWGRIGSPGTVRAEPFTTEDAARAFAAAYVSRKQRKGYA